MSTWRRRKEKWQTEGKLLAVSKCLKRTFLQLHNYYYFILKNICEHLGQRKGKIVSQHIWIVSLLPVCSRYWTCVRTYWVLRRSPASSSSCPVIGWNVSLAADWLEQCCAVVLLWTKQIIISGVFILIRVFRNWHKITSKLSVSYKPLNFIILYDFDMIFFLIWMTFKMIPY